MAWRYDPTSRQFQNDSGQWGVGATDTGVWGLGNGQTSYAPLLGDTKPTDSGMAPEQLYSQFPGAPSGYSGGGIYDTSGGGFRKMASSGGLTGQMYVNPNPGPWPTQKIESSKDNFFDMPGLGILGPYAALAGPGFVAGAAGGAGTGAQTLGGSMDLSSIPYDRGFDFTPGQSLMDTLPAGGSAADPMETFVNSLNSGMPSDQALQTVEKAFPGTTQSVTQFYMNNPGQLLQDLTPKLGSQAAQSAVGRLLSGNASAGDWASIIGKLGATALGVAGASQQTRSLQQLANRFDSYGAPYRARLAETYANPTGWLQSPEVQGPVQQGVNDMARALSMQAPGGSVMHELTDYASNQLFGKLGQERDRLAGFGGLTGYSAAAPAAMTAATQSQAGPFNALGAGLNTITNPQRTLAQDLMDLRGLA